MTDDRSGAGTAGGTGPIETDVDLTDDFVIAERAVIAEFLKQSHAEGASLARWVLASMLAVNGTSLVAVFNAQMPVIVKAWVCPTFVIGVVASLATGILGMLLQQRTSFFLDHYFRHLHGKAPAIAEQEMRNFIAQTSDFGHYQVTAGIIALGAFILGVTELGIALWLLVPLPLEAASTA